MTAVKDPSMLDSHSLTRTDYLMVVKGPRETPTR